MLPGFQTAFFFQKMLMNKVLLLLLFAFLIFGFLSSCSKDDHDDPAVPDETIEQKLPAGVRDGRTLQKWP